MKLFCPLPVRDDWTPAYLKARGDGNRDYAFFFRDPQGMPDPRNGVRYHGGVDWFAPAGTTIRAPLAGTIVRADGSNDISGPVFGGVIALRCNDGLTFVMRHVQPIAMAGLLKRVEVGDPIGTVSRWDGGGPHLHMEIWKDSTFGWSAGYRIDNCIDPKPIEWTEDTSDLTSADDDAPRYYFEELPFDQGGTAPRVLGPWASRLSSIGAQAKLMARGRPASRVREGDRFYVLEWPRGGYGDTYRFGPWLSETDRERARIKRAENTGRRQRPFADRARSLYPWPKGG